VLLLVVGRTHGLGAGRAARLAQVLLGPALVVDEAQAEVA
jgi:hypothetical protein